MLKAKSNGSELRNERFMFPSSVVRTVDCIGAKVVEVIPAELSSLKKHKDLKAWKLT